MSPPPTPPGGMPAAALVSASTIAEMADVSPSAVSNWRRRHADFPAPVATAADGGDLFDRDRVERWLAGRDIAVTGPLPGRTLWHATVDTAADGNIDRGTLEALALLAGRAGGDPAAVATLPIPPDRAGRAAAAEYLLARRQRAMRRGADHDTHPDLVRLLVALAEPLTGTVCDTAAGLGSVLLAAGTTAAPGTRLVGVEIDPWACRAARLRLAIHGIDAEVHTLDALRDGGMERGRADVVLCDAPIGQRLPRGAGVDPADPRWVAGDPGPDGDLAWLQHAAWLARPDGGRALVVTAAATTWREGRVAAVRSELLRRGMVEAVVVLPAGSAGRTTRMSRAIWSLRPPPADAATVADPAADVLLIDASAPSAEPPAADDPGPPDRTAIPHLELIAAAVQAVRSGAGLPADTPPAFATLRPVLELLRPGAPLNPAHWCRAPGAEADLPRRVAAAARRLEAARTRLAAALNGPNPAPQLVRLDPPARTARLGDLIAAGRVELLRTGRPPGATHPPGGRPPGPGARTEPGDIIITRSLGGLTARVDPDGATPLPPRRLALRVHDATIAPHLLAAAITASHPAPPSSRPSTAVSAGQLDDIPVPLPDGPTAAHWSALLVALDDEARALTETAAAHRRLAATLHRAAASGELAPTDGDGETAGEGTPPGASGAENGP